MYQNPNVVRDERRVQIEVLDSETINVTLVDTLRNTSLESESLTYYYPLPGHADSIGLYVDARAEAFEVFSGKNRLERLFDQASKSMDARLLRLGATPFEKLLESRLLDLPPEQTMKLKLEWRMKADFVNDFHFSEIFLHDDIASKSFDLTFSITSDKSLWHFFTNLPQEGLMDRNQNQVVLLYSDTDFKPQQNLRFFWSHIEYPTLEYSSNGSVYYGHFQLWGPQKDIQELVLLIDTSGSMTGNPWIRTKEYVNFILERLDEKKVKVVFFDKTVRSYAADFRINNHDFRKGLIEHLHTMRPLAEGNLELALQSITDESWTVGVDNRAVLLITDQDEYVPVDFSELSAPVVSLGFTSKKESYLELLSYFSGGFYQRLFHAPPRLIEAEEFWDKWGQWRQGLVNSSISTREGEVEVLPEFFPGRSAQGTPVFVGRSFDMYSPSFASAAAFLPRIWAARRIGQILRSGDYEEESLTAIRSISRRYGVRNSLLVPGMAQADLRLALREITASQLLRIILELERATYAYSDFGGRFVGDMPFEYLSVDKVWQGGDFLGRAERDTLIGVHPFSEAHRALYVGFAPMLAQAFGMGDQVEFCTVFRCISVRYGYRKTPESSDRSFFVDYDPRHWANPYFARLIEEGVFEAEANGKIHPSRPVDRADFLKMLYRLGGKDGEVERTGGSQVFSDVVEENDFSEAVNYFAGAGVVKGYEDGTFRPYLGLTRAEAVKVLLAADGWKPTEKLNNSATEPINSSVFPDVTDWARPWVEEAYSRGIISGFEDGTFRPQEKLSRAAAAKLLVESLDSQ